MVSCKCCGGPTTVFATADFSRTCEDRETRVFPLSGEPVTYQRCHACGFIFTVDFDTLSSEQLAEKIYNHDYILADPGFTELRPRYFADVVNADLGSARDSIVGLDFGGGKGRLAEMLRGAGFATFQSHDPFFGQQPAPERRNDLVTAFEVVEHSRDPIGTFREMLTFLRPGGLVLFSTLLQPSGVDPGWWYLAPRNGHVSLHSHRSLEVVATLLGLRFLSVSEALHLFYRLPANLATRLIVRRHARAILRIASLHGIGPFVRVGMQLAALGHIGAALDPRHLARALARQIGVGPER